MSPPVGLPVATWLPGRPGPSACVRFLRKAWSNPPSTLSSSSSGCRRLWPRLFFDHEKKLLAAAINLACPAQEVEGRSTVNADFFHEVREALREKHGRDLKILGWIGAAGDQSPHLLFRTRAEDRMRELRGLTRLQEIARRIVAAFGEAYDGAKQEIRSDVVLAHRVARFDLPVRLATGCLAWVVGVETTVDLVAVRQQRIQPRLRTARTSTPRAGSTSSRSG